MFVNQEIQKLPKKQAIKFIKKKTGELVLITSAKLQAKKKKISACEIWGEGIDPRARNTCESEREGGGRFI